MPTFGPELAAMIGIGVGIDYALFIVTRYRQGLDEGRDPRDAVVTALDTSGRAVLFAGCTVVISLLGMFLLGSSFVYGLAFGAIVGRAAGDGRLAHPAAGHARLRRAGHRPAARPRVPRSRPAELDEHGFWYRWSRVDPAPALGRRRSPSSILLVLAIPLFSLQMLFTDAGNDPTSLTTRQAYDLLAEGFGPGANGPLVVAVDLPGRHDAGRRSTGCRPAIAADPGVAFVVPPQVNPAGDAAVIVVIPTTSPQATETEELVHHAARRRSIPTAIGGTGVTAYVGGVTAAGIDAAERFSHRLLWVIGARRACCRSCC